MDEQMRAVVPVNEIAMTTIQVPPARIHYDDGLAQLGQLANKVTATKVFTEYRKDLASNTRYFYSWS
jgi:hypothetical protein